MNQTELLDFLYAILPAIIIGIVAFYFLHSFNRNEENRRRFEVIRENRKTSLPVKLQAYERLALFLERTSPGSLLFRVKANSDSANAYANLLVANIEQEFEHNLVQQIYVSTECWDYIKTAKNATINLIRKASSQEDNQTADQLRENILRSLIDKQPPAQAALAYIRKEVKSLT